MKKKGFTLIELLAVILILGIIALIAIPTVTNIIKESKRGAFKSSVQNIINVVETECQLEQMRGEELTTSYSFTNGSVDNELNIKGDLPKNGTITVDSSCNVTVDVTDGTFTATKDSNSDDLVIQEVGEIAYTCIRATSLHTEECTQTRATDFCSGAGYTLEGSKGTTTITYGNLGTSGILSSGDAFDCDVNNDGTYDPETERFYYVSDYYNTSTKQFETDKATLIYYSNTKSGVQDSTYESLKSYYSGLSENWHGPVAAVTNLPTKEQWTNPNLITGTRAILAETGANSTAGGELPTEFDYSNYAARLITAQEINSACEMTVGLFITGELDACNYLMENTMYSGGSRGVNGYWLETPYAGYSLHAFGVDSYYRLVSGYVTDSADHGTRPVITLLKSNISSIVIPGIEPIL